MTKRKVSLVVSNGIVVTVDKNRRVISKGSIAVDGPKIVAVDKAERVETDYLGEEVIDASGAIVCPGLIDTHVHLAQALLRGCGEEVDALTWLREKIWPLQGHFTKRDGRASAALCILEMITSGTTSFLEVLLHQRYGFDDIADVVRSSGIKGVLSKSVMDRPSFSNVSSLPEGMIEEKAETLHATVAHLNKWRRQGEGRVMVWFGPRPVGNCTPDTYREIATLAKEHATGVTIHHAEVKEQVDFCKKEYGMLPTEFMEKVGLVGRNVVYGHCIFVTKPEIGIMHRTGTNCSDVPSSNMKLAMGVAPVSEMLRAGVNVGIGCNAGPNSNTYDMFREMARACLLQRVVTKNPMAVSNSQALEMATINGAKALGLEEQIGSIEVGKRADFILVDCTKPHMQPLVDPIAALVHSASGADVDTTIVDGRVLMKRRRLSTMKAEAIIADARRSLEDVLGRAGVTDTKLL